MAKDTAQVAKGANRPWLSLDGWAVLLAFVLAALVRFGVLNHIPW